MHTRVSYSALCLDGVLNELKLSMHFELKLFMQVKLKLSLIYLRKFSLPQRALISQRVRMYSIN